MRLELGVVIASPNNSIQRESPLYRILQFHDNRKNLPERDLPSIVTLEDAEDELASAYHSAIE